MIVLKLNALDLSSFARVAHDEGMDPAPFGQSTPAFAGSPAFREGQTFVGDAVTNAERVFPVILSADSLAELYQLIRDIEAELGRGSTIEFANDEADARSYFDLERGRLEIDYEHWIVRHAKVRATLRCWTKPYAHTGTNRLVASFTGATAGVFHFPVTGILGDVAAEGVVKMRAHSGGAVDAYLMAFGVSPNASYNPVHFPASANEGALATMFGDARALGSQGMRLLIPQLETYEHVLRHAVNPKLISGRSRAFGLVRSRLSSATGLKLSLWAGLPDDEPPYSGADPRRGANPPVTAMVTAASQWQLVDFGEITVPGQRADEEPVPTCYLNIYAWGAISASAVATYPFHYGGLILLPVDKSVGAVSIPYSADGRLPPEASQFISIRSTPRTRAVLHKTDGSPSSMSRELMAHLRGAGPRIPPVGSPGPSGPARMVVMTGQVDNYKANLSTDVIVEVRERWRFLR